MDQDKDDPNIIAQAAEAENVDHGPPTNEGNANDEEEGGAAVIAEAAAAAAADEDDSSVAAADNEAAEDPTELDADLENEGAEQASAMALGALVEQDDDIHRQRFAAYRARKQHLITSNWKVTMKPPKKKGIEVRDRVSERGANPRYGIVISGRKDPNATQENLWTVHFDGDEEATIDIKHTQLRKPDDNRTFVWKIVRDSSPDESVTEYQEAVGIVGFDFLGKMAPYEISADNIEYKYPFLDLLIHFWPGKSALFFLNALESMSHFSIDLLIHYRKLA